MKINLYCILILMCMLCLFQKSSSQQLSDDSDAVWADNFVSPDTACTPFNGPIYFGVISLSTGKIHANVAAFPGAISYNWYINGVMNTTYHSNGCNFNVSKTNCDIEYDIAVEVIDSCGTSAQIHANAYMPCDSYFRISPNPAKGSINVSVEETKLVSSNTTQSLAGSSSADKLVTETKRIYSVRIADNLGNVKKTVNYKSGVKTLNIPLAGISPGLYIVSVFDKVSWKSQTVIVE